MPNWLESDGAQLTKNYTLPRLFTRAHRRVARLARFEGLPPETVSRLLCVGILPVLLQSAIAFTTATATREIETLQIAIDASVRATSQVPALSERMTQGGLGVPSSGGGHFESGTLASHPQW